MRLLWLAALAIACHPPPEPRKTWLEASGELLRGHSPAQLAVDDRTLYFVDGDEAQQYLGGSIVALPKSGGEVSTLYRAPEGMRLTALALGGDEVFTLRRPQQIDEGAPPFGVIAVPKSGGEARVLYQADVFMGGELAVDDGHAYFLANHAVWRVARAGGEPEGLFQQQSEGDAETNPVALALDPSHVYVGAEGEAIWRLPKSGGEAERMASSRAQCLLPIDGRVLSAADGIPAGCPLIAARGQVLGAVGSEVRVLGEARVVLPAGAPIRWLATDTDWIYAALADGRITRGTFSH